MDLIMAETTELHRRIASQADSSPKQAEAAVSGPASLSAGAKVRLFFKNAIFWRYERGGWQYDIICIVILAFIFFTPRSWFGDRPTLQLSDLRHVPGVIEIRRTKTWRSYQIDARLVDSAHAESPEQAVRLILLQQLKKTPEIESIQPIRDKNQVILGYTVVIAQ
jgi:hypothetical protein